MGPYPQLAIFRKFGSLNMLNLLSLQAELTRLEKKLKATVKSDDKSVGEASKYSTSFLAMLQQTDLSAADQSEEPGDPPEKPEQSGLMPAQWRVILEIRRKLDEYSKLALASWSIMH